MEKEESADELFAEADRLLRQELPELKRGIELMFKAAELGHPMASYAVATWYLLGNEPYVTVDFDKAIPLLEAACRAKIAVAYYDLAVCYSEGEGVEKSAEKAFENYLRAALHGDHQSINTVGQCYYFGEGVPEDKRMAEIWFDRAEELGVYEAEEDEDT